MAETKKYEKTKVVVTEQHYDPTTKLYNSEVETKFYKTLPFSLEIHEKPIVKEWDWGKWTIIWQLSIANKNIGIRERDWKFWKQYAWTIIKWEFFVNLEQVLSRSEQPSYEVTFVEKNFWNETPEKDENGDDLPF